MGGYHACKGQSGEVRWQADSKHRSFISVDDCNVIETLCIKELRNSEYLKTTLLLGARISIEVDRLQSYAIRYRVSRTHSSRARRTAQERRSSGIQIMLSSRFRGGIKIRPLHKG